MPKTMKIGKIRKNGMKIGKIRKNGNSGIYGLFTAKTGQNLWSVSANSWPISAYSRATSG